MPRYGPKPVPIEKRFWDNVDIKGSDECWPWIGCLDSHGYGLLGKKHEDRWILVKSHRFAYELMIGPIPEGLCILHRCDNPSCCNATHLSIGTQLENITDMNQKGRGARGQMYSTTKLTEEQVVCIMARLITGRETQREISADFNVGEDAIGRIWRGETWKYLFEEQG